ncbi:alpha-ketoacid dehydrogenase subunit beta [Pseudodesulfovibrio sediminis]|uniref:Transketolase-like pyrimidine-binding domain-containing protein n=1 Tax=Pseudodesulfovibrio sediminis TaxID=2810563 RepID=A0ABN6EVV6_9BACT|nr:transketolase C-terminal domain-containing protein [Pseudodesulfovibrio sediminis]BCS89199.1 hypothetical protein PSDVSF_24410 [Pseudodesulfovibrio sediminis]
MTTVLQSLNQAFHRVMEIHPDVLAIGEDIVDPYGGAFKVTRGLSTAFGDRVISSPISEAGITGLGIGLTLQGFRPVVEIMFGDFITLCADQLVNQASKIATMYSEPVSVPLIVRTPMGGRRGYGPTHSQTLERMFLGVSGLDVIALSPLVDCGSLFEQVVLTTDVPTLFVENKSLYAMPILNAESVSKRYGMTLKSSNQAIPTMTVSFGGEPDVTVVTYGGMVPVVLEAVKQVYEKEDLLCEVIVPHCISSIPDVELCESVSISRRLVVAEESGIGYGWGSEVIANISRIALDAPPQRVGASESSIPVNKALEAEVLPQVENVVQAIINSVDEDLQ